MISRRKFILSSTAAAHGCLCHGGLVFANATRDVATRSIGELQHASKSVGCMVAREDMSRQDLGKLGTGQTQMSSFASGNQSYTVGASSGNPLFDRALAEALYHLSTTFDVLPTFGFIKGGNVANAFATSALFVPEPGDADLPKREDGTVLFGSGIMDLMRNKGVANPVAAVLAICAHEFGHIVQYRYVYQNKAVIDVLSSGQSTVKRAELHADFLAGFYIGVAKKRNPDTPAATVAQAAHAIGDWNVNDPSHHGTPEERGAAVYEGYKHSYVQNKPFNEALVDGLAYVQAI